MDTSDGSIINHVPVGQEQTATAINVAEQDRCWAEQRRLWQAEEYRERHRTLSEPLSELARRLLIGHPTWAVLEQIHLDHASIEIAARVDADVRALLASLAEKRMAEL